MKEGESKVSSYKDTNPIVKALPSSKPNRLPKIPSPNTTTFEVMASTYQLWRHIIRLIAIANNYVALPMCQVLLSDFYILDLCITSVTLKIGIIFIILQMKRPIPWID